MDRLALLEDTIEFWQSYSSRHFTQEDGRQAVENISGFFETLEQWATAESTEADGGKEVRDFEAFETG
jgi:hypothetical protein